MNIVVQLADYAQGQPGQKVNALGMGWTRTGTPLGIHSLILLIEADENERGMTVPLYIRLVDESGTSVTDQSGTKLDVEAEFHIGESADEGEILGVVPVVLSLAAGLPLEPGFYKWEVTSPSFPDEKWTRAFKVVSNPEEAAPSSTFSATLKVKGD
ncbi:hypothetical protein [Amycolatopsis sp. EV170708-02-1]|uniref:hypothetical protein n=1 Tax=Amycolatopsis sp. EV170708-02-1 TaxID=2919322 RepID=UPI001F0C0819|nr:hypothetical protein [Amycolatopsis sp. EV170708-02-1]UMP02240.1 hypothetical protein MJQ72_38575 [Amycolatopsis sp. EV170708-02-1]